MLKRYRLRTEGAYNQTTGGQEGPNARACSDCIQELEVAKQKSACCNDKPPGSSLK